MTDNEIIKALEYCRDYDCVNCTVEDCKDPLRFALSLINRQKAELDDLKRDDFPRCKDALRRANEIGREVDEENVRLKAEIAENKSEIAILRDSNINLQELYQAERVRVINARQKVIDLAKALKPAKAEAIKEFAERLCEGRVSNDPVVIAVGCELKEMVGDGE